MRLKRAMTVSPERLVKSTKKRRLVAASGGNARPSSPCSPPETIAAETSRKSCASTEAPPATQTINGTERIGWDQPAADAVDLAAIRYAMYVDGTRTEAAGVACAAASTAGGFACTARLPALAPGLYTLQLASFVDDGRVLESERSAALQVTVTASTAA